MSTYPISLLHDNSILIVDRDIVLCMIMDTCMSWVCHFLHCFAVSNCAAFWPIFLDHGTIGKNMELYYWIAGGVLPKIYCSICLYSVSYVSLPSRHCTVIPKTIEHDRTVVYHELGRLYWMYCMAELCCFSEAIVHSKRFLPSDFLRHTFNTIQGRRYDVNVMRGTAMKIERISRHSSCLQHKLWCRYTLYYTIEKHDICDPEFQASGSDQRKDSPLFRCTTSEGGASPSKNRGPLCWLDHWQSGFLTAAPFQEKLRMAQEQMRRAETKCPINAPWLEKIHHKKSIITMMIIISCAFFKTIWYKWFQMMYNSTWPSLSSTFFYRPVINSRRHAGWDTPERVGVWGGQVRISLKS